MEWENAWKPESPGACSARGKKDGRLPNESPCWPPDCLSFHVPWRGVMGSLQGPQVCRKCWGPEAAIYINRGGVHPCLLTSPVLLGTQQLANSLCARQVSLQPWLPRTRQGARGHQHLGSPAGSSEMPSCPARDVDEGRNDPETTGTGLEGLCFRKQLSKKTESGSGRFLFICFPGSVEIDTEAGALSPAQAPLPGGLTCSCPACSIRCPRPPVPCRTLSS